MCLLKLKQSQKIDQTIKESGHIVEIFTSKLANHQKIKSLSRFDLKYLLHKNTMSLILSVQSKRFKKLHILTNISVCI